MKKSILSIIICFSLICTLMPATIVSYSNNLDFEMSIAEKNYKVGDSVTISIKNNTEYAVDYYEFHIGDRDVIVEADRNCSINDYEYTFEEVGRISIKADAYGNDKESNNGIYLGTTGYLTVNVEASNDDVPKITEDVSKTIEVKRNAYYVEIGMSIYLPYGYKGTWELYEKENGDSKAIRIKTKSISVGTGEEEDISFSLYNDEYTIGNIYYIRFNLKDSTGEKNINLFSQNFTLVEMFEKPSLVITSPIESGYNYVNEGDTITLTADVDPVSKGKLTYQWYIGSSKNFKNAKKIVGEKSKTLTTTVSGDYGDTNDTGYSIPVYYFCEVTNTYGEKSATNQNYITVNVRGWTPEPVEPDVTIYNTRTSVNLGDEISFVAKASSNDGGQLSFQWYRSESSSFSSAVKLIGETNATYIGTAPSKSGTWYYFCQVTNTVNSRKASKYAKTSIRVSGVSVVDGEGGEDSSQTTDSGLNNFKKIKQYADGQFTDVKTSDWFYSGVKDACEIGLLNGKSEKIFDPKGSLTIAEALTIAARLNNIYNGGDGKIPATEGKWYQCYVDYCISKKMITGGTYNYTNKATRAEFAYILARAIPDSALAQKNNIEDNSIPDVDPYNYCTPEIYKLYRAGVLSGNDSKGTFKPQSNITRGEVALIITRMAIPDSRVSLSLK